MSFITPRNPWRDVRLVALTVGLVYLGEFLVATSLLLRLHDQGASGPTIAGLMVASAVAMVATAPAAGRLVDRVDSRTLLVTAGVAQVLTCSALAWVDATAAVLALVALLAAGLALVSPTVNALVPTMVDRSRLPRANSLIASATTLGLVLGPALGGVLTGAYGSRVPVACAAGLYGAAAVAGLALHTRRGPGPIGDRGPKRGGFVAGLRLLRADRAITGVVALSTLVALLLQVTNVVEVFMVRDTLQASATMFGLIGAVWMVGMFAGSWVIGLRGRGDDSLLRWALVAAGLQAVALAGVSLVPGVWWLVGLFAAGGLGNGAMNVARQTLLGRRAPEHARGRIFSAASAIGNVGAVISLGIGGVIVGVAEPRVTYAVCGALCLVATAVYAVPLNRLAERIAGPAGPVAETEDAIPAEQPQYAA